MKMAMPDLRRKQPELVHQSNDARLPPPPLAHMAKRGLTHVASTVMFSHNMSHLRGAKPCGSCGGR